MKLVLFLFALFCAVHAQDIVGRIIIDDFSVGANQHKIEVVLDSELSTTQDPQVRASSFSGSSSSVIGGERDMEVRVFSGFQGRSFNSDIFSVNDDYFQGEWSVASPKTSSSRYGLQYDGPDNSFLLVPDGLGGVDFTDGGAALGIRLSVIADLETQFTIGITSTNGQICDETIRIPSTPDSTQRADSFFLVPFGDFDGNCDLEQVGSVTLELVSTDALDAIVRTLDVAGPAPSASSTRTAAPTQSPTPPASASRTPAPSASATPTPSNSGPCIVRCDCPSFTCQIVYDTDAFEQGYVWAPRPSIFYQDDSDTIVYITIPGTVIPDPFTSDSDSDITIPQTVVPVPSVFINDEDDDDDNSIASQVSLDDDDDNITIVDDDDDNGSGSGSSSAGAVCVSFALLVFALFM